MSDKEQKNNPFDDLWDKEDIGRFLSDTGSQVHELQQVVDRLNSSAPHYKREDILLVFGNIHTIKGVVGFMGHDACSKFLQVVEQYGDVVKKSDYRQFSSSAVEALGGVIEVLRRFLETVGEKGSCNVLDGSDAVQQIFDGLASEAAPTAPSMPVVEPIPASPVKEEEKPAVAVEAVPTAPEPQRTPRDKLNETTIEIMNDFVNESLSSVDDIERMLSELSDKGDMEVFRKMFGVMHTLKGASAMIESMGVGEAGQIRELTHKLEGLITAFKDGTVQYGKDSSAVLDECFSAIREMITSLPDASKPLLKIDGLIAKVSAAIEGTTVQAAPEPVQATVAAAPEPVAAQAEPITVAAPVVERRKDEKPGAVVHDRRKAKSGRMSRIAEEVLDDLERRASLLVLLKNRFMAEMTKQNGGASTSLVRLMKELDVQVGALNDVVSKTRLQPLKELFDRYHLPIREIARKLNKTINLRITGADTEIDKQVAELINEPLIHIIRNSADHGIETPDKRRKAGKSEAGTIHIDASRSGSMVAITIADDGAGLNLEKIKTKAVEKGVVSAETMAVMSDQEVYQLIFEAGFSTADKVTDISGRGVGMDFVKRVVTEFRGYVTVDSTPGRGSKIIINLPLKSSVLQTLLVRSLPKEDPNSVIAAMEEVLVEKIDRIRVADIEVLHGKQFYRYGADGKFDVLPVLSLREMWGFDKLNDDECTILIIKAGTHSMVLAVDEVLGSTDLVIKPLPMLEGIHKIPGIDAASILGDGSMAFVLDMEYLLSQVKQNLGKGEEAVQKPADPEKRLVLLGKYDGITYGVNMQNIHRGDIHTVKASDISRGFTVYRGKTVPVVFLRDVIGIQEEPAEEYNMIPFYYLRKESIYLLAIKQRENFLSVPFSMLETTMANAAIEFNFPDGHGGQIGIVRYDAVERLVPGYVQEVEETPAQAEAEAEKPKVLCVDDDLTFQHQITSFVRKLGGNPIIAGNGLDAMNKLRDEPDIGLVLMDVEMPVMDGFKAMAQINVLKEERRISGQVKVIILSDRQDEKTKNYCIKELKSDGYLVKSRSDDHDELMSVVQEYVLANLAKGGGATGGVKIMSVEDAVSFQRIMRKVILKAGGTPIIAKDADEAVKALEKYTDIKLIFLDIEMPGKSGYEAIGELKKINPNVPIYMLTDRAQQDIKEYCMKMGADGFLLKKEGSSGLLDIIHSFTGKAQTTA
ncbi:MAG: hybrid sensor histidine kinase/response regulator [Nitrospinae bacterium]|nr:hybrid sensor histidine kinase/response regulator [Nitrospinota bacterium]